MLMLGDMRRWLVDELRKNLEKVINLKADRREPYYILVLFAGSYAGPAVATKEENIKDTSIENKRAIGTRLVIMNKAPAVPLLNTALWYVDNKRGEARCMYILPRDCPAVVAPNGKEAKIIFDSAVKTDVPLIYN
jgi:hypothetical protein